MRIASQQAATAAAFFVALSMVAPASAMPGFTRTVDCTRGHSITQALEHAPPGMKLTLIVRGTCNESVLVDRDDVVLQGDPRVGGTVNGPDPKADTVLILGNRVSVTGLTVTGGQAGITAWGANNVVISDSVIRNTNSGGIKAAGSNNLFIFRCRIEHNTGIGVALERASSLMMNDSVVTANSEAGVHLGEKSNVNASNNTITDNGANGVQAFDGSHASMWNNTITGNGTNAANIVNLRNGVAVYFSSLNLNGNQIANHPIAGVGVTESTLNAGDNTIVGNGDGLIVYTSQIVLHTGNVIRNNKGFGILLNVNSTAQISGATVQYNAGDGIMLQWDSKLVFFADAATTSGGNGGYGLHCPDRKSSVVGLQMLIASPPNGAGAVSPGCAGFD